MSLGKSLPTFRRGLVGKDLRGDCEGNLRGKTPQRGNSGPTLTSSLTYDPTWHELCSRSSSCTSARLMDWTGIWRPNLAPVQVTVVFKFLCSMPSFDVFHDVSLEELPQELQSLVASHLGTKVVVASQKVVEVVHRLGSRETPVVAAEMCPVPPERHASAEKLNCFIPLQKWGEMHGGVTYRYTG